MDINEERSIPSGLCLTSIGFIQGTGANEETLDASLIKTLFGFLNCYISTSGNCDLDAHLDR